MKKIFTLLAACFATMSGFAQTYLAQPESGKQYYITIGDKHVGYVTAGEDGAVLTAQKATEERAPKQTWTATKNDDDTWTFTATTDEQTWTIYTSDDNRLHAGTAPGELTKYTFVFHTENEADSYAAWQMLAEKPENGQAYANIFGGQNLGNQYGPWTDGDTGSKVYFIEPGEVEIPTWNYDLKAFDKNDNSTRYFLQFNRNRATNTSQDGGPKGTGGLTGDYLVLGCNGDTLVADSVIAKDATMANKIWHIVSFDAETHKIELQNEAGQYIIYKTLDAEIPGGNDIFKYNEETGRYDRTGKSGGGKMTEAWMVTTKKEEAASLYVFANDQGSECYSIGDSEQSTGNTFINSWGNVGWHHLMGKWSVNDPNCAFKFVPITDIFAADEMPEIPTGIHHVATDKKTATDGNVYTVDGRIVGKSLNGLPKGLYIMNGKKILK